MADLVPRCTDPVLGVRQNALLCVQRFLQIQACYQGAGEAEDPIIDAVTQLAERAEKTEATAQFAVVNDLAKVRLWRRCQWWWWARGPWVKQGWAGGGRVGSCRRARGRH